MFKTSFLYLSLLSFSVTAQQFSWLKSPAITFNQNPSQISYPLAIDTAGNTYVCGFSNTPVVYTDTFGNVLFQKYSTTGTLLFNLTLSGEVHAYKLAIDAEQNCYLAVSYLNSLSVGNLTLTSSSLDEHPVLLKFDPNGNVLWYKSIEGAFINFFRAIAVDENNNVYIGYDNYLNSYIEKMDASGNTLQLITQTNVKLLSSVAVDTEGNIYAAGSCAEANGTFNGTPAPTDLLYNTYIVKYNAEGIFQWLHHVEDVTCIEPKVVAQSPDEVYFASYLFDNYNIGSIATEGPSNFGYTDFFLTRLNSEGTFMWVREIPGSGTMELAHRDYLALDATGAIYLYGNFSGVTQWNPQIITQSDNNQTDVCLLKYNPDGTLVWAKLAGGAAQDRAHSVAINTETSPKIAISGMSTGNIVFDSHSYSPENLNYYPFVAQLTNTNLAQTGTKHPAISALPNPFQTHITITNMPLGWKHISISDVLGQSLHKWQTSSTEEIINTAQWNSGVYFVTIEASSYRSTLKMLKL